MLYKKPYLFLMNLFRLSLLTSRGIFNLTYSDLARPVFNSVNFVFRGRFYIFVHKLYWHRNYANMITNYFKNSFFFRNHLYWWEHDRPGKTSYFHISVPDRFGPLATVFENNLDAASIILPGINFNLINNNLITNISLINTNFPYTVSPNLTFWNNTMFIFFYKLF